VIASTARKLTRDQVIGGWHLPAGTVVNTSILLAHQRRDSFPDAITYRPDRFLGSEVEPNTWLPFGGGFRRCIGAGFSLKEGTAVLRRNPLSLHRCPFCWQRSRARPGTQHHQRAEAGGSHRRHAETLSR
jgi:cytochrome P450